MTLPRRGATTPSMKDVADRAGVSKSTVSLVLSGKHEAIPVSTRERVLEAAADLGYRRNVLASGLRRQASDTVGVISDLIATTPHAGAMVQGVQDAAWEAGKLLMMVNTGGDAQLEARAIEAMLGRQIEGILYATMYHRVLVPPAAIREVPAVLLDARAPDSVSRPWPPTSGREPSPPFGTSPSLATGESGSSRVRAASRRLPSGSRGIGRRWKGSGSPTIPHWSCTKSTSTKGAPHAATQVLGRPDRPSALFCFNDRMAAGAVLAARRLGLSVPADLSIVGFDNEELVALLVDPPLTTVQLPHYEMGRWAMAHLLGIIADPGALPEQYRMPCPLVVRASTAPVT